MNKPIWMGIILKSSRSRVAWQPPFPNLRLMTEGAHHIARLLEMCADDRAAGEHGRVRFCVYSRSPVPRPD
jgi:hypothetical protein